MGARRLAGKGGEGRRGTNPFPITVLVLLIRFMQVHAIETADRESHDDLDEAEDGVRDVGEGHFGAVEETHFVCLSFCFSFLC
jgi:hypothetical protein